MTVENLNDTHTDYESLRLQILADQRALLAASEDDLRRSLAEQINAARREAGFSLRDLAKKMGTSLSQVQRLLHEDQGGTLTLRTICLAADALGHRASVGVRPISQS